jgi:DNA-binding MarR family transcriptional regulator
MSELILDTLNELRKKCISNDCLAMEKFDLSPAEYEFFLVYLKQKSLETSKIAFGMGLSLSRLSRVIEKLVINGYLTRKAMPGDRRAIQLAFTSKGKQTIKKVAIHREQCEKKLTSTLNKTEKEQIERSLKQLISRL